MTVLTARGGMPGLIQNADYVGHHLVVRHFNRVVHKHLPRQAMALILPAWIGSHLTD